MTAIDKWIEEGYANEVESVKTRYKDIKEQTVNPDWHTSIMDCIVTAGRESNRNWPWYWPVSSVTGQVRSIDEVKESILIGKLWELIFALKYKADISVFPKIYSKIPSPMYDMTMKDGTFIEVKTYRHAAERHIRNNSSIIGLKAVYPKDKSDLNSGFMQVTLKDGNVVTSEYAR